MEQIRQLEILGSALEKKAESQISLEKNSVHQGHG